MYWFDMLAAPALTIRQVARLLSVNERTVYRMATNGRLPAFRVAGAWRFLESDLLRWVEQQKSLVVAGDAAGGEIATEPRSGR